MCKGPEAGKSLACWETDGRWGLSCILMNKKSLAFSRSGQNRMCKGPEVGKSLACWETERRLMRPGLYPNEWEVTGIQQKWTTSLIKLSLAFLGTKMLSYFLVGISFTFCHWFSLLKLSMCNLTFSCWLELSINIWCCHPWGRQKYLNYAFIIQFLFYSSAMKKSLLAPSGCSSCLVWQQLRVWLSGHKYMDCGAAVAA